MGTLKVLYKAIFRPLEVLNREVIKGKLSASVIIVLVSAFLGSVLAPALYYLRYKDKYDISLGLGNLLVMLCVGISIWFAECILFQLFSRAFKKEIYFAQIVSTWGLSFIPNLLGIAVYSLLQLVPEVYNGSGLSAFIFSVIFITLLVWKAIYYFMFMKFVIDTTLKELVIITLVAGVVFFALMSLGFAAGIQVPML